MFVFEITSNLFCRKCKSFMKVCGLLSVCIYEIRHYKSIRLNPCSNGCGRMFGRSRYNDVEMILSPVACWQKRGTEIHTWSVPCRYCYFTKYSAYPRGMRSELLLFSLHFTNHVFGFPAALSPCCIQVPKHMLQQSGAPLVNLSPFTSNDTCSQIASHE